MNLVLYSLCISVPIFQMLKNALGCPWAHGWGNSCSQNSLKAPSGPRNNLLNSSGLCSNNSAMYSCGSKQCRSPYSVPPPMSPGNFKNSALKEYKGGTHLTLSVSWSRAVWTSLAVFRFVPHCPARARSQISFGASQPLLQSEKYNSIVVIH